MATKIKREDGTGMVHIEFRNGVGITFPESEWCIDDEWHHKVALQKLKMRISALNKLSGKKIEKFSDLLDDPDTLATVQGEDFIPPKPVIGPKDAKLTKPL